MGLYRVCGTVQSVWHLQCAGTQLAATNFGSDLAVEVGADGVLLFVTTRGCERLIQEFGERV